MPKYFVLFSLPFKPDQIRNTVIEVSFPIDSEERVRRVEWLIADQYFGDSRTIILHEFKELTPTPAMPLHVIAEDDQTSIVHGGQKRRIDLMEAEQLIRYLESIGYLSVIQLDDLRR